MNDRIKTIENLDPEEFTYSLYEPDWWGYLGMDYDESLNQRDVVRKLADCIVGWCPGDRLQVRPKSDQVAVMCDDGNDRFWFHCSPETLDMTRELVSVRNSHWRH